jgi:predicted CopG family antitoxin
MKTIGLRDDIFKRLNIIKTGLEVSWSDYILSLDKRATQAILAQYNLKKANERIAH